MTDTVQSDIAVMVKNQLKRKKEDEKLAQAKNTAQNLQENIRLLKEQNEQKQLELMERKQQLESHKKFSEFLSKVVHDPEMKDSGSEGKVEWLRDRFINLKNENKKLKDKKAKINMEMEAVKEDKRQRIQQMTATIYQKNQQMQKIQQEIESIAEVNSGLEQEFENELGKKNKNSTEVGQIISSINNIYRIVEDLAKKKNKLPQLKDLQDTYITYEDEKTSS